jgi:hypothetical protein
MKTWQCSPHQLELRMPSERRPKLVRNVHGLNRAWKGGAAGILRVLAHLQCIVHIWKMMTRSRDVPRRRAVTSTGLTRISDLGSLMHIGKHPT